MSGAVGLSSKQQQELSFEAKLAILSQLPVQLASASEHQVLQTAAEAVIEAFPAVQYIRMMLVSQDYQPNELLEWCHGHQISAAMAAISSNNTSQQVAMRRGMRLHTQQLHPMSELYDDWCMLQQQFGMQSFAAVPLTVAGTVYGVIMAAASDPGCFNSRSIPLLETVANMLAPYAAVFYKHHQATVTKSLLRQLLPARVVDAAVERLGLGDLSAADMFSDANQELPDG